MKWKRGDANSKIGKTVRTAKARGRQRGWGRSLFGLCRIQPCCVRSILLEWCSGWVMSQLRLRKMSSLVAQTGSLLSSKGAPPKRQCSSALSAFTWTWSVRVMLCNFYLMRVREWCCVREARQCIGWGSQVYQVARTHMWRQCHRAHSSLYFIARAQQQW